MIKNQEELGQIIAGSLWGQSETADRLTKPTHPCLPDSTPGLGIWLCCYQYFNKN